MKPTGATIFAVGVCITAAAFAKVDLVTLPKRDMVQLTIYNSADMTLVRESRKLTLQKGANKLQFSWANTLIDPTSLEILPKAQADKVEISDLTYPPRVGNLGMWNIKSEVSGEIPVEISYLTSGFSWRAFYMGTLSPDEKTMRLEGYVRVTNNSGEDYENAQTRLIVGQVHILDEIAELARRQYPYGRPIGVPPIAPVVMKGLYAKRALMDVAQTVESAPAMAEPKEIKKEGLSEYFLYTIEGTETIRNGWSKRLPSFEVEGIPVVNLYKYEEERYGNAVVRFLSFKNDQEHKLGETPIPGGMLYVYRLLDADQHLAFEGQSNFKYIPVGEDIELDLGPVANVIVKPTLMDFKSDHFLFDAGGDVIGWDEIQTFKIEVKNRRSLPVKVEIRRNFCTPHWDIETSGDGAFEKVDLDTVKFTVDLPPFSKKEVRYVLTTHHGRRAD